jgi:hypothetical protein
MQKPETMIHIQSRLPIPQDAAVSAVAAPKPKLDCEHLSYTSVGTRTRSYPSWIPGALHEIAKLAYTANPPSCYATDEARAEIVNSHMSTMPEISATEQDGYVMVRIYWPEKRLLVIGDRYRHSS